MLHFIIIVILLYLFFSLFVSVFFLSLGAILLTAGVIMVQNHEYIGIILCFLGAMSLTKVFN